MGDELLGWLCPGLAPEEAAPLRRAITVLRLLRDDARHCGPRAPAPWPAARGELERLARLARRRALETLLRALLAAHRPADSFLELGASTLAPAAAWRELLGGPDALAPPAPDEPPAALAERLVRAGLARGAPAPWAEHWRAAALHVLAGPAAGERAWRRALRAAEKSGAPPPVRARFLAGRVAACLERTRPRAAWALFARHATLAGADPVLRRLLGWSALLAGAAASARELLRGVAPAALPVPLARFRTAHPEWAVFLPGTPRVEPPRAATVSRTQPVGEQVDHDGRDEEDPRRALARTFLGALERSEAASALWLEPDGAGHLVALARRGARPGAGRTFSAQHEFLARALIEGRACHAGERGAPLARDAAAGLALALRAHGDGSVLALLVLESPRPRAFDEGLERALAARLAACERAWWAAAFRATHRRDPGEDLALFPEAGWLAGVEALLADLRARPAAVLVAGAPGSGRRTLACWLEFRAARALGGVGRVERLEGLARERHRELARGGARAWLVAHASRAELRARGELAPGLATALHPRALRVPPLAARRDELPALVRCLVGNAARRLGRPWPSLSDEALACLWRQPWPGEVAELGAVLAELVRVAPAEVGLGEVRRALAARALDVHERLAEAGAEDLAAVLAHTRHRNGSANLARAARYLGWSPARLAARLRARPPAP